MAEASVPDRRRVHRRHRLGLVSERCLESFDLRTLSWIPGPYANLPFAELAIAVPVVSLAAAMVMSVQPSRRIFAAGVVWRLSAWTIPLVVLPMICFTIGVLTDDLRRTGGWTLAKQNLGSIVGRSGCGLADDVVASLAGSEPLPPSDVRAPGAAYMDSAGSVEGSSALRARVVRKHDAMVPTPTGRTVRHIRGRIDCSRSSAVARVGPGRNIRPCEALRADAVTGVTSAATPWTFLDASELPMPAAGASAVRIVRNPTSPPPAPLAVTAPVRYRQAPLSDLLSEDGATALIHPALFLYFPCARQPALQGGIVDASRYFVWYGDNTYAPLLFATASPFLGVPDLFPVGRLPSIGGADGRAGMRVYEIDPNIGGAERLAPDAHDTS